MKFAWQILIHTPIWVFPLFAYLVWLGIKATRPRAVTIWRSLIVPAVFIVWGLSRLVSRQQDVMWPLVSWLAAAAVLLVVGLLTARPFELDHTTGEIKRPGSWVPLIRNVTVFALQYTVAVIAAVGPHDATTAAIAGRLISGGTTGYFLGRTIALLRQYWKQRKEDIKAGLTT
jgi:Family of unknown function (DUF6622)